MSAYRACTAVSETNQYITNNASLTRLYREVKEMSERQVERYKSFLTESEKSHALQLIWGLRSVNDYNHHFLVLVLMNSYRVFDESHTRYPQLLKVVKENDPEWVERIEKNHEDKIHRCKVSLFNIEEATAL